jgi:hypothetical protein
MIYEQGKIQIECASKKWEKSDMGMGIIQKGLVSGAHTLREKSTRGVNNTIHFLSIFVGGI